MTTQVINIKTGHVMNPEQARMYFIRSLQNEMLEYLYNKQEQRVSKVLHEIAIENQILLKCDTTSFAYGGKIYGCTLLNTPNGKINKELHPSLLQKVYDTINTSNFDAISIKTHINHMFGIILSKAQHIDDLKQLLPSAFLGKILDIPENIFNIGKPLSNVEYKDIKDKTKTSTAYINELYLTRLLLTN